MLCVSDSRIGVLVTVRFTGNLKRRAGIGGGARQRNRSGIRPGSE